MKNYTRKELKQPDEFITFSMKAWGFLQKHLVQALITLTTAVLLMGAVWAWSYFSDARAMSKTLTFSKALELYSQPLIPSSVESPKKNDEEDVPRYKTRLEKLEATEKQLAAVASSSGNFEMLTKAIRAGILFEKGKFKEAKEDYQRILNHVDKNSPLSLIALEGAGYCAEAMGALDEAMTWFGKITGDKNTGDGDKKYLPMYHRARILAKQGKRKEAIALFKTIANDPSSGPFAERSSSELMALEK